MSRPRVLPEDDVTRQALIDAAEDLFGRHGIAATSLRSILRAAKQKNMSAIHYHFGTKAGLVIAIIETRRRELDVQVGAALLGAIVERDSIREPSLQALLRAGWRPMVDYKNAAGRRAYARFVRAVLFDLDHYRAWLDSDTLGPNMKTLKEMLRKRTTCSEAVLQFRFKTLHQSFYHAVTEYDALEARGEATLSEEEFFEELTGMLSRAWSAT